MKTTHRAFWTAALLASVVLCGSLAQGQQPDNAATAQGLVGQWARRHKPLGPTGGEFYERLNIKADKTFEKTVSVDGKPTPSVAGTWRLRRAPSSRWRYEETSPSYKKNLDGNNAQDYDIRDLNDTQLTLFNRDSGELVLYTKGP